MVADLEDDKSLAGADGPGVLARLERKAFVFQLPCQVLALEVAEVSALLGRGAVGFLACNLVELGAFLQALVNLINFGPGGLDLTRRRLLELALLARLRRGSVGIAGDQNLAQTHALRLREFALVLIVKLLNLVAGGLDVAAHLGANDLLREDAVLGVGLEVLPTDALRFGNLLQLLHGVDLHLLAKVVQALDQVGIGRDTKVGGFLDQQLLINQIAQSVLFTLVHLRLRQVHLTGILRGLLLVAAQIGTRNDGIIDAGDDLLHHRVLLGKGGGDKESKGNERQE